jgi:hypothetical protein
VTFISSSPRFAVARYEERHHRVVQGRDFYLGESNGDGKEAHVDVGQVYSRIGQLASQANRPAKNAAPQIVAGYRSPKEWSSDQIALFRLKVDDQIEIEGRDPPLGSLRRVRKSAIDRSA